MTSAEKDRLLHDAEHAEAGAEFAERMAQQQPWNETHSRMAAELAEKARSLRRQAEG